MTELSSRICPEDVVCLANDPSTPGMVCCVGDDSDSRGAPPTAHVYWLREQDNDRMEPISELTVLDRALLHGDTVMHGKRKGMVTATKIYVDMRYSDGTVVSAIDTAYLRHLQPFRQGNWVVSEGWLGRVLSCRDDVVVQFDDGSQCLVSSSSNGELQALQKMYERSPYFPSLAVKASSAEIFADAKWLEGSYTGQKSGIIASNRPAEVMVAWIAALQGSSSIPPATSCAPEALQLLNHFGHTWWRLGDRTVYARPGASEANDLHNCCEIVVTHTEVDIKYLDGSAAARVPATQTLMFNPGPHEFYPGDLVCEKDPADKDRGAISVVLSADERSRMASVRRVRPQRAKGAASEADAGGEGGAAATTSAFDLVGHPDFSFRIGDVVLRLDAAAGVSAHAPPGIGKMLAGGAHAAPTTSSGSGASRPRPSDVSEDATTSDGAPRRRSSSGADGVDGEGIGSRPSSGGGSGWGASGGTVGEVVDIDAEGMVLVAWLGAETSAVHPEQIYRVAIEEEVEDAMFYQDDGGGTYPAPGAPGSAPASALAPAGARDALTPLAAPLAKLLLPTLSRLGDALLRLPVLGSVFGWSAGVLRVACSAAAVPLARLAPLALFAGYLLPSVRARLLGAAGRLADGASGGAAGEDGLEESDPAFEEASFEPFEPSHPRVARVGSPAVDAPAAPAGADGAGAVGGKAEAGDGPAVGGRGAGDSEPVAAAGEAAGADSAKRADEEGSGREPVGLAEDVERVQVVESPRAWEAHHYAARAEAPRSAGKFMARVRREWNLLRCSLPADIYATVYEDRADLLQAVIKGPQGTPYADGLFFFDVQLPAEYPDVPPRVYYHAHGDRVNPNLYENGKVCLSLLGTWAGSSVESWDPKKSNILQVLVSIQGLILVPEPYYNEPSYEQYRNSPEGDRSSKQYNESALLLTLQSILASSRDPPASFATLAALHYRETRQRVLERCHAKLAEAKAECAAAEDGEDCGASLGFALSLERLIPKLAQALGAGAQPQTGGANPRDGPSCALAEVASAAQPGH